MDIIERRRRSLSLRTWMAIVLGAAAATLGCSSQDIAAALDPDLHCERVGDRTVCAPMVGSNYTHHSFLDCAWDGYGILRTYAEDDISNVVEVQLREMHSRGVESLRLIVWHMRDVSRQSWGVVPSRGGRLPDPYRTNLIAYLMQVRRVGFQRLTISFSPQWTNSPLRDNYEPDRFEENWSFIQDIRALAVEYGPDDVRFDLLNEGAPSDHAPPLQRARMNGYVRSMWRRYTDSYGSDDVTVSVIAPASRHDQGHRLENLIDALGANGGPMPEWFEIHLNYQPDGVAWGLHQADSVLTARGLTQPLIIGETSYNDAGVATAISAFMDASERPLDEVLQWYRRAGAACEVSPPYEAGAYLQLRGTGGPHALAPASPNSASWSSFASASTSALGWSSSQPSGAGLLPELLMR